jgi:hypothetical protein
MLGRRGAGLARPLAPSPLGEAASAAQGEDSFWRRGAGLARPAGAAPPRGQSRSGTGGA